MMMFMVTLLTVVLTAGCSNTTNSTLKAQETTTPEESTTLQNVKALPMLSKFLTGVTSSVSSEKESTEATEEEIPFEDKDEVRKRIQKSGLENWNKINKEVDTWYDESNSLKFSELSGVERETLIKPISSCMYNFSEPKNSKK